MVYYRNNGDYMPDPILEIISFLDEQENRIRENPALFKNGTTMVKEILSNKQFVGGLSPINVIPEGVPGECRNTLVVSIGSEEIDIVELRILQAIEHIYAKCRDKTRFVIFWAVKWDGMTWMKHAQSFKDFDVTLKLFGSAPVRLN